MFWAPQKFFEFNINNGSFLSWFVFQSKTSFYTKAKFFKFIQKRHLNNSIQFLQKKYQGFNRTCIGPTINFHPDINPKIEVDPIINGEEKNGGLYFHGSFCLGHSWRFDCPTNMYYAPSFIGKM